MKQKEQEALCGEERGEVWLAQKYQSMPGNPVGGRTIAISSSPVPPNTFICSFGSGSGLESLAALRTNHIRHGRRGQRYKSSGPVSYRSSIVVTRQNRNCPRIRLALSIRYHSSVSGRLRYPKGCQLSEDGTSVYRDHVSSEVSTQQPWSVFAELTNRKDRYFQPDDHWLRAVVPPPAERWTKYV